MSRIAFAALAIIATGAACATTVGDTDMADTQPIRCELNISESGNSVIIEAEARADRPMTGTYTLDIRGRSAGGSSMISQSGDFEISPGTPTQLGQATLGGRRANYSAELTVTSGGVRQTCSDATL
jgi:hypothetical protein